MFPEFFLWKAIYTILRGRHGRDRMVVDLKLPVQSVPITTEAVETHSGKVYFALLIFSSLFVPSIEHDI
jgi:hypothetical protein